MRRTTPLLYRPSSGIRGSSDTASAANQRFAVSIAADVRPPSRSAPSRSPHHGAPAIPGPAADPPRGARAAAVPVAVGAHSSPLHLLHAAVDLAPPLLHAAAAPPPRRRPHRTAAHAAAEPDPRRAGRFLHAAGSSPRRTSSAPPRHRLSRASQVRTIVPL
jgi:hypothetical protein